MDIPSLHIFIKIIAAKLALLIRESGGLKHNHVERGQFRVQKINYFGSHEERLIPFLGIVLFQFSWREHKKKLCNSDCLDFLGGNLCNQWTAIEIGQTYVDSLVAVKALNSIVVKPNCFRYYIQSLHLNKYREVELIWNIGGKEKAYL